ncbi:drug resistance transporter, Bcr/CflA subfamily [Klebsiella pneumoniae subsp. rhinoscleromatis ATCC 13884]|nr:drug resistance transporter, Bcr/CflA subfamily [Klebsiella pneumoniae subsp. rhinoscleromatis ATCC 13884]STT64008.1 membrane transport protein [Klebsiella pneumoniae]STW11323.1 membrane transport protein [Klebsiella pneumoniae subsp. rhinoscleromatis]
MARVSLSWALILGLLSGIGPLCTDFYLPALPEITQQLQATSTQTQLSLTAALIGLGLGQLFFGPLSDRIGRLKPLALSLLLFIFSSAMCALTRDINMLIVWRFLQGFAGAGGSVLSRSIARDKYQGTLLTQFFALLMTVNGIAPVLSPVLGGYVITAFDWRILFWTMAAIGGVLLVMSLAILRETRPATAAHASRQRPGQPVLKNRRFLRFCLIQAFMMAGLFSYIGSSSFVMQSEYGMSAMQFSLLFGLNGIGLIIAAMIFSRLARRFSAERLLRGGLTLAVSCAAIMLLFAWLHLPVLALVGLFFTVSLMSDISTVAGAEAMSAVDAAQSGTARADGHPDVCLRRHRRAAGGSRRRNDAENEPRDGHLLPAGAAAGPQQTARRTLISCCGNKIFQIYYRTISRHIYHSRIILHVLIVILFTGKE